VQRIAAILIVVAAVVSAIAIGVARKGSDAGARCGAGFLPRGTRCVVEEECPAPLVARTPRSGAGADDDGARMPRSGTGANEDDPRGGCDAPDTKVLVPAAAIAVGPSDWEAEGRVEAKTVRVQAFRIDAFEVTVGKWDPAARLDTARAATGMTRSEAADFCARLGGRLPTEDEWVVAAMSAANPPRRYPWGDTGAVCRRAAWGLLAGPCANGADGADTVGAHADGDTPLGLHDMAGNVAEWVAAALGAAEAPSGLAKGGSWETALASDLRVWARRELPTGARARDVGFRCAYPP
jgi:formylglycine-generating enzyme required for sulfatase activity